MAGPGFALKRKAGLKRRFKSIGHPGDPQRSVLCPGARILSIEFEQLRDNARLERDRRSREGWYGTSHGVVTGTT